MSDEDKRARIKRLEGQIAELKTERERVWALTHRARLDYWIAVLELELKELTEQTTIGDG